MNVDEQSHFWSSPELFQDFPRYSIYLKYPKLPCLCKAITDHIHFNSAKCDIENAMLYFHWTNFEMHQNVQFRSFEEKGS